MSRKLPGEHLGVNPLGERRTAKLATRIVATLASLTACSLALSLCGCGDGAAPKSKFTVASGDSDSTGKPSTGEVAKADPPKSATKSSTPEISEKDAVDGVPKKGPKREPAEPSDEGGEAPAKPPVVSSDKLGDYKVPDGEPEVILAYMQQLAQRQPRGKTRPEVVADMKKIQQAKVAAAAKLLSLEGVEHEQRLQAVTTKLQSLQMLGELGEKGMIEEMGKFLASLSADKDPQMARVGRMFAFRLETMSFAEKVQAGDADPKAMLDRIKKFLAAEEKDVEAFRAVQEVASLLEQLGKRELELEALQLIGNAFASSDKEEIAEAGQYMLDKGRLLELDLEAKLEAVVKGKPKSIEPLLAAIKEALSSKVVGPFSVEQVTQSAGIMERTGNYDAATRILAIMGEALKDHPDEKVAKAAAEAVENGSRRLGLVGKPFTVEGELIDGSPFDWSKYQGKVVLIDFWATWCGPCIKEIPNIKRNYDKYHAQGFEVVGINCDDDNQNVERFFATQELPWATVRSSDPETLGFKNPLVVKCGVDSIPFLVLVNKEGVAEAIHVRGDELGKRLAAIFDGGEKPDAKPGAKPAAKKPAADKSGRLAPAVAPYDDQGPTYFIALADEEPKAEEEANPYLADEGLSPEELAQFILKMQDKPKSIQKRPGFGEAIVDACDRVLKANAKDKQQFIAIESKLDSLHKRACLGDEKCDKALQEFVATLKDDARERVAREVRFFQLEREVIDADKLPLEELPALFARLKEYYGKEQLTARHLRLASSTVALVNRLTDGDSREKEFKEFGGLLAKSSDKQLARYGKKIAKTPAESESKLVGQPLELAGTTADGQAFKWEAYRGKVVLVDFWATWCGPCRKEMPHVKELYEKHKDKGFEVVGISLDKDLEALAEYLQENNIAWSTLSGEETQDLAEKYGVRGIPTMMLVDKEGKVVAVSHNVEALQSKLEKLLAPAAADKPAQ